MFQSKISHDVVIAALALAMMPCAAWAGGSRAVALGQQLPEITCDATSCSVVREVIRHGNPPTPQAAIPLPYEVAPPAGQRLLWRGGGYPSCQSIIGTAMGNPYDYIKGESIDVPLGSTHASLAATFETKLSGGPDGTGAAFGVLQVRRSGGTWQNVSFGYASTFQGNTPSWHQYTMANYMGLVDLATLAGGTGIPSTIDVRMAMWANYAGGFIVSTNEVCKGLLLLSF